jgi:preprotein translocase subunit SecB
MSDGGNPTNGEAQPGEGGPPDVGIQAISQYIKDLSFENPAAPMTPNAPPQIEFTLDPAARKLDEQHYEVELKLRISAKADERPVFLLELIYAGLFMVHGSPPEDFLQQVLLIDAPQLLFPFARRIVSDTVRDGGMPPLLLTPINFAALYRARAAEGQLQGTMPTQST